MKNAESARAGLSVLNLVLALLVVGATYRTFFSKATPEPGEVPDRLDPRAIEIKAGVRSNTADAYLSGSRALDRPKAAPPPPAPPAPSGPPPPEDLGRIFQVVAVAINREDPKRSSVILQRRGANPNDTSAQQQVSIGGDKLENAYALTKIEENEDKSVTVTILDQGGRECKVRLTREELTAPAGG